MMFLPNYCIIMLVVNSDMISVKYNTYCSNKMLIRIGTHWQYKNPKMLNEPSEMIYSFHFPKSVQNIRHICFNWKERNNLIIYSVILGLENTGICIP